MTVVNLTKMEDSKKFNLIKQIGFSIKPTGQKFILSDQLLPDGMTESFINTEFKSINEIVACLSGYLYKVGYKVVM